MLPDVAVSSRGHVVARFLEAGFQVRGTVRSLTDTNKVAHLQSQFPALKLFEADLLTQNSFEDAFRGADIVIHCASPFILKVSDPQRELLQPAVDGTTNVITTALRSPTVKRIVVTSSVAAMRRPDKPEGYIVSESDWNEAATVETMAYALSKTLAERAAWKLVADRDDVRLVTVNPSFVLGPVLSARSDATSVSTVASYLNGACKVSGCQPFQIPHVDVRDVTEAHFRAATYENANGRYLVSSRTPSTHLSWCNILAKHFKDYPIPDHQAPGNMSFHFGTNPTKAEKELGMSFRPLETSLVDMANSLIKYGVVKPPQQ